MSAHRRRPPALVKTAPSDRRSRATPYGADENRPGS